VPTPTNWVGIFRALRRLDLAASEDGHWLLATVANGDGGDYAHYLRGRFRFVASTHSLRGWREGGSVWKGCRAVSACQKKCATRKILRLPLAELELNKATVVVPEGPGVIGEFVSSASGLYAALMGRGPSRLWFYPKSGSPVEVPVLPVSSVGGLHCWHGDDLIFANKQLSQNRPGGMNGSRASKRAGNGVSDHVTGELRRHRSGPRICIVKRRGKNSHQHFTEERN